MSRPKRHRHSKDLDVMYGFAYMSGWLGIGGCWYCKGCSEVLWFEEDHKGNYPHETKHNNKKRKKNKRYDPFRNQTFQEKQELKTLIDIFDQTVKIECCKRCWSALCSGDCK